MIEFEKYEEQKVKVYGEIRNAIISVHNILWWIAIWCFIMAINSCDSHDKVTKAVDELKQIIKKEPQA